MLPPARWAPTIFTLLSYNPYSHGRKYMGNWGYDSPKQVELWTPTDSTYNWFSGAHLVLLDSEQIHRR